MRSSALMVSLLGVAAAACGSEPGSTAGPRGSAGGPPPSLLLVTIDSLRADHVGCYGYDPYPDPVTPTIDALAAEGVRFTRFFVPRGQTAPSMCTMLVGKYPSSHGVRDNGMAFAGGQTTLFERLRSAGYRTGSFPSRMPHSARGDPSQGAETCSGGMRFPDGREAQDFDQSDEAVTSKLLGWLEEGAAAEQADRPFFGWIHLYGVHHPYMPVGEHAGRFTSGYAGELAPKGEPDGNYWHELARRVDAATVLGQELSRADHEYVIGVYDECVRAADDRVQRILARLEELGLAERTIVVVSADHGEELGDHNDYYYHGASVYDSTLHVPLLVRWPGRLEAGRVVEHLVESVDLAPTLLDWIGIEAAPDLEGVSLAAWLGGSPPGHAPREVGYLEWQDLIFGTRTEEHVYLFNPSGAWPRKYPYTEARDKGFRVACEELYDLRVDAAQRSDLISQPLPAYAELRRRTLEHRARPAAVRGWKGTEEDSLEVLAELGYVGSLPGRIDVLIGAEDCGQEDD